MDEKGAANEPALEHLKPSTDWNAIACGGEQGDMVDAILRAAGMYFAKLL